MFKVKSKTAIKVFAPSGYTEKTVATAAPEVYVDQGSWIDFKLPSNSYYHHTQIWTRADVDANAKNIPAWAAEIIRSENCAITHITHIGIERYAKVSAATLIHLW